MVDRRLKGRLDLFPSTEVVTCWETLLNIKDIVHFFACFQRLES